MSNCETIRIEIPSYLRGRVEGTAATSIRQHLQTCGDCQKELEGMQRLDGLLDRHLFTLKTSPTLASSFANRLAAEIAAGDERAETAGWLGWLRPLFVPLTLAAAAAAVAVAVMPRGSGVEPPQIAVHHSKPAPEVRVAEQAPSAENKPAVVAAVKPSDVQVPAIQANDDPELYVDFDVIRNLDQIAPELVDGAAG